MNCDVFLGSKIPRIPLIILKNTAVLFLLTVGFNNAGAKSYNVPQASLPMLSDLFQAV